VQEFLKKLFVFSAIIFVLVMLVYAVLYFTNFGKQQAEGPAERQLNVDPALVAAYSSGLGAETVETIVSLYGDGNASVAIQGPGVESGISYGLWERVGDQIQFYFSSGGNAMLPDEGFALDVQGDSLVGLDSQTFVRLEEGSLSEDITDNEEGPQGIAVRAAMDYVENVLGGTEVTFVDMIPTRSDCTDCFTVSLSYTQAGFPATIDLQVEGGTVR